MLRNFTTMNHLSAVLTVAIKQLDIFSWSEMKINVSNLVSLGGCIFIRGMTCWSCSISPPYAPLTRWPPRLTRCPPTTLGISQNTISARLTCQWTKMSWRNLWWQCECVLYVFVQYGLWALPSDCKVTVFMFTAFLS